jgi:hypothetical protein
MTQITNRQTLEARQELRDQVALAIATLRTIDTAIRRNHRKTIKELASLAYDQSYELMGMAAMYQDMPNKEES